MGFTLPPDWVRQVGFFQYTLPSIASSARFSRPMFAFLTSSDVGSVRVCPFAGSLRGARLVNVRLCPVTQVVKGAADETPLTLAAMRDYLEGMIREESTLGPEAAAKVRFLAPVPEAQLLAKETRRWTIAVAVD